MASKPLILIIDDSDDFREIWKIKFNLNGFDVAEVKNGKEAIELLKTQKPNIILIDFLMPEMNGIETYLAIKNSIEIKDTKIFFLTSMDDLKEEITKSVDNEQIRQELINVAYIKKTMDLNEIVNILKQEITK